MRVLLITAAALAAMTWPATMGRASTAPLRGAQMHALWSTSSVSDFDRELDLLEAAGANVVRVDFSWSSLEKDGKGLYSSSYTSKMDTFVAHAHERGIKVVVMLWST